MQLTNEKVCVIIPARNEIYLPHTIEDVLKKAEGDIEVIPILDGYDNPIERCLPQDPCVKPIVHEKAIGQRHSINLAARQTDAKYILKADGHSMFDQGFDIKLKADCEYDWTVIPRMFNLDVVNWTPKLNKMTDFMWFRSPDAKDMPLRVQYWDAPIAREFPDEYQAHKNNPDRQGKICDVMTGQGACWFIHRKRFWDLGGMDEAHGQWGQMGVEVACKAWLSGGRQVVNKNTWFSHWFRKGDGPAGIPWPMSGKEQRKARKYSIELWGRNKWPQQVHDLQWLADKFAPLPTWQHDKKHSEFFERVTSSITDGIKADTSIDTSATKPANSDLTILYYTANVADANMVSLVEDRLKKLKYDIISITQKPTDLGKNICVGKMGRSLENIYRQVLIGAHNTKTEYVALCEDDCFYTQDHFDYRPQNKFAYNLNRWNLHIDDGLYSYRERPVLSQCIAPRQLLIRCLEERFALKEIPKKHCGEMGVFEENLGLNKYPYETFETPEPNLVLCHDKNITGKKLRGKDADPCVELKPWGYAVDLINTIKGEPMKFGRGAKQRKQHSYIGSIIFDSEELYDNRIAYSDPRKNISSIKEFILTFPPFMQNVADGKDYTNDELVALPYFQHLTKKLNPADRDPLTSKGKRHCINLMKDAIRVYRDIEKNGLRNPLDMWRIPGGRLVLHRGGRRLEMLKILKWDKIPCRIFKSRDIFIKHNPSVDISAVDSDSIHGLAMQQFMKLRHLATDKYWVHGYTRLYDKHIGHLRNKPLKFLEIGVLRGASLLLWKEAFPQSQIFGIDKNTRIWQKYLRGQKNIKVFVGHQEDTKFLSEQVFPSGPYDIIVDDGGHLPLEQQATFRSLWPSLNSGGFYIIEDLYGNYRKHLRPDSTMEILKKLIDDMHEQSTIKSISFYYNICFIEKA